MAEIGEIIRLTVSHSQANASVMQLVFTWSIFSAAPTDSNLLTAVEDWLTNDWLPDWQAIASNECTMDSADCVILNADGTVKRVLGAIVVNDTGSVIGDPAVAGAAGFMYAPTIAPKTRGRKFIPGIGEPRLENGVWNTATLGALVTLATTWITGFAEPSSGAAIIPGVLSRTLGIFRGFLTSAFVTNVPAYQRRRKPGVGS